MNFFLVLSLFLCYSSSLALATSSFLNENQNTSNISVIEVEVSHSNITGFSNFVISCSSVPTQVAIVAASGYDFDLSNPMIHYFNLSRVLNELGENSMYIDYRYYRVYAKISNSASNTNISVDLPTKHNFQENLTAVAWCMDNTSQSSGYSVGPYGPFNNGGVPLTITVTYSIPLRAEEVELQANLLTDYLNLSFYSVYDILAAGFTQLRMKRRFFTYLILIIIILMLIMIILQSPIITISDFQMLSTIKQM